MSFCEKLQKIQIKLSGEKEKREMRYIERKKKWIRDMKRKERRYVTLVARTIFAQEQKK